MNLTENALKVLRARYLLKDERGTITETPEELFRRVARHIASPESLYGGSPHVWEEQFFSLIS